MKAKVMFVTGAGSGMGRMTVARALKDNWKVAAVDINMDGMKNLGEHDGLLCMALDVTQEEEIAEAVERCENQLGPISRLVNAAAIMPLGELKDQKATLLKRITEINYFGLVNSVCQVLPGMIARGEGEIVSYSSMAGHWPMYYMGGYNASKAAVTAYSEVLHYETKHLGIRVVCVCPPIVSTPLLDQADNTVRPQTFDVFAPITPDLVLDEVEKVLPRKSLWVFPGPLTRLSWLCRRMIPRVLWSWLQKVEKFPSRRQVR